MATFPSNPPASAMTGAEIVPITQGGVDKRTTIAAIGAASSGYIEASVVPFSNSGFAADNLEDAIVEASGSGGANDRSTVTDVTSASGVVTLDWSAGDYFRLELSENVTSWVIDNPPGSGRGFSLIVEITQDSTPRTVAKPGTAPGGTITVSTGSGDIDLLAISSLDNGATLRSNIALDYT